MKMQNVTKLTLTALVAAQFLSINVARATMAPSSFEDPRLEIKSYQIREISDEEALEFINEDQKTVENKIITSLNNKAFNTLNIPNIPPVPPTAPPTYPNFGGIVAPTAPTTNTAEAPAPGSRGFLDGVIMVLDKLVAIGEKIIPTIEKGRAVVTNNPMAAISVLPLSENKDPVVHDMGGWSIPVAKHYNISFKNGMGTEVVSFVYSISYQYGGSQNGKGKYLTGIRASARKISVDWGFDLDATSQLIQISNVGTQANVVAGATLEMTYTVKNWTRLITNSVSFHITGEGRLYKLD